MGIQADLLRCKLATGLLAGQFTCEEKLKNVHNVQDVSSVTFEVCVGHGMPLITFLQTTRTVKDDDKFQNDE